MFENLSDRLGRVVQNLKGQGRITEDNIKDTLREVRMALLEADVALPVVKDFIEKIREKAVGEEVIKSVHPGHQVVNMGLEDVRRSTGARHGPVSMLGDAGPTGRGD